MGETANQTLSESDFLPEQLVDLKKRVLKYLKEQLQDNPLLPKAAAEQKIQIDLDEVFKKVFNRYFESFESSVSTYLLLNQKNPHNFPLDLLKNLIEKLATPSEKTDVSMKDMHEISEETMDALKNAANFCIEQKNFKDAANSTLYKFKRRARASLAA